MLAPIRRAIAAVTKGAFGTPVRPSLWGWVREPSAGAWQSGVTVDPLGSVASFGAVYACVSRIASDVSKLTPQLLSQGMSGVWSPAGNGSPFWGVVRKPNGVQNRIQFYSHWLTTRLLYGNAYALKQRDARGIVVALHLLDPRRVTPMVTPAGDVYYSLGGDDLSKVPAGAVVPAREILHDRCVTLWHPLVGISPIYACGMAATQGLRIQSNSANFFGNMSRPSGVLSAPAHINDETAERLKRDWQTNFSQGNIGKLAVLGDGLNYQPMAIAADDAQLIEQLRWTVEDVARAFAMPLYKIGAGPVPTAGNVEMLNQQYYADCLQVHIEAIELLLTEGLELPAGMQVEFDLDGLLRTDQLTYTDVLTKSVGGGVMTPNEARRRRNLPPTEGGDAIYLQEQNFSLAALAKRDAREDPFASAPAPAPIPEPEEDQVRQMVDHIIKGLT